VVIELCMEVGIEPIRVDAKPDIVDTEAGLGIESRIHNLASSDCGFNGSASPRLAALGDQSIRYKNPAPPFHGTVPTVLTLEEITYHMLP
jgi:hypothetical protein